MSPSDSDDNDEDEHESTDSDTDEDTGRHDSSIRLDIGLQPVTDLVRGLVDVDVSNPPRESNRKGDENQSQPDRESRSRWSKPISTRPNRERTSADTTRESADSYHVTAHRSDDEATIVADLPGVEADELSVELAEDSNAFVIAVDGTVVRRVSLPWNHAEVSTAQFNNSILEVRLHSADEEDD
ncbi:Hsp20/alpha crystallin family protein [Haladaptatus sp. NG-WS-4]